MHDLLPNCPLVPKNPKLYRVCSFFNLNSFSYPFLGYGLTSPRVHLLPASFGMKKLGSVGPLLPNLKLRLVADAEGLVDAEEGQDSRGEIWVRGPTVMKGYLNNARATREAITPDGWFKTGDMAHETRMGIIIL